MAKKGKYCYEWPRPMVTVDAVIFRLGLNKTEILLILRGNEPYKDMWALPGGFVDMDEELEDAVVRELKEETGLTGVILEQMQTFGKCGRDPRGRQISIAFFGIVSANKKVKGGDDAAKAKWFDIKKIPENLAFDHDEVIKFGINILKNKKAYISRSW